MSVCTGAFVLASTGLLSGKSATTHHGAYVDLAMQYPDIHVQRGARFVESGNLASAGGLTSGMDLAFRVVERYFGRDVASQTATLLEYQGQGWLNPNSNSEFAGPIHQTADHPVCAVCGMPSIAPCRPRTREGPITSASKITSKSSIAPGKLRRQMTVHRGGSAIVRPALSPRRKRRTSHCIDRCWRAPESLRRSLDGFRQLLPENLVRYEPVANGQRWLGACGIAPYTPQTTLHSWRDSPLYDATSLQLARFHALIGAMSAIAQLKGGGEWQIAAWAT